MRQQIEQENVGIHTSNMEIEDRLRSHGQAAMPASASAVSASASDSDDGSDDVTCAFRSLGGDTLGDDTCADRSALVSTRTSATMGPSDDQEDGDDDDVSMAGSEAINHEEDPGYATSAYGADAEDMLEDMEE